MAKIKNTLPPITTNTGGGTSIHNDLSGLNVGNYIHLTAIEKTKFDNLPNTFAPIDAEKNVNTDWDAISGDEQLLNKPSTFPPSIHTHLEADITDLDKYTQLEVDNLLDYKFDNPIGNNTQYLDGAGIPTTFPTIPSAFNPSEHDLEEFLNEDSDPYARQSEVGGSQNIDEVLGVGNTAIDKELILDTADADGTTTGLSNTGISVQNKDTTDYTVILDSYVQVCKGNLENQVNLTSVGLTISTPISSTPKSIFIDKESINHRNSAAETKVGFETPTTDEVFTIPNETGTGATREWVTANPPTIVVDADDVTETATRVFVTPTEKTAITHSNRSTLDLITEAFTTALKTAYDDAVSWISTNGTNVLNHLTRTDNPHSVTKSQVGLSNVDNTSDVNKPVSTAQATAIGLKEDSSNKSTSTSDIASTTKFPVWSIIVSYITSLGYWTSVDATSSVKGIMKLFTSTGSATDGTMTQKSTTDALDLKVDKTSWIDISATSTIVGWSSFAQKSISYKITDGTLECVFYLEGTSNSTSITFTLPNNSAQGFSVIMPSGYNVNNGGILTNSARIIIPNASNVVNITRDFNGSSYTGSGTKAVAGRIAFKI